MDDKSEFGAAHAAGMAETANKILWGASLQTPAVVVPKGYGLKDAERFLERPVRKRACPSFVHEEAFNHYVRDHLSEASRVYANKDAHTMTAVLDAHEPNRFEDDAKGKGDARKLISLGAAAWRDHKAIFAPPKDVDWQTWIDNDEKPMSQTKFGHFLEDMIHTIVEPDGAELLEIAMHFETVTRSNFKTGERLQDGARVLHFDDTGSTAKMGRQSITVPEIIKLRLPVFYRDDAVEIEAKLRYRTDEGRLFLFYKLHRPDLVADACFEKLRDGVAVMTGLPVYLGTP